MAITPVVRLKFGDESFDVVKLMASEVAKIQAWTGCGSKRAWINLIGEEDIDAYRAGYALMKQRRGEDIRFSDVDFDTDTMEAVYVEGSSGREIAPVLLLDADGEQILNAKGEPQPVKVNGDPTWTYVDDGSPVPPTPQA